MVKKEKKSSYYITFWIFDSIIKYENIRSIE